MKTLAPSSARMIPLDPVGLYTHTARLLNEKSRENLQISRSFEN